MWIKGYCDLEEVNIIKPITFILKTSPKKNGETAKCVCRKIELGVIYIVIEIDQIS